MIDGEQMMRDGRDGGTTTREVMSEMARRRDDQTTIDWNATE